MLTLPSKINPISYNSSLFQLTLYKSGKTSSITMQMNIPVFNTLAIPQTRGLLNQHLPTIYEHKCFNDQKLPFSKEVLRTEIGHLFEHVLIEYLYQLSISSGNLKITLSGETSWDWTKQSKGIFNITINHPNFTSDQLRMALSQAITLTEQILKSQPN